MQYSKLLRLITVLSLVEHHVVIVDQFPALGSPLRLGVVVGLEHLVVSLLAHVREHVVVHVAASLD